jgi:Nucleotidyl transferase AbiEii toxin, Type IV TA system
MPINELHRRVATVALRVATRYGFALGGGNALIAHGLITRPTMDVDLFTNEETGVEAAAGSVEAALREAGFGADREDKVAELSDMFEGADEGLAEWTVTAHDGQQMMLQMAYFDRTAQPVTMDVGPVLSLEDVVGGKVCALASRAVERDYVDTAAALGRGYSVEQLIGLARALDPGLTAEDFAEAGSRLDHLDDEAFSRYRLSRQDVAQIRERFAAWPRT